MMTFHFYTSRSHFFFIHKYKYLIFDKFINNKYNTRNKVSSPYPIHRLQLSRQRFFIWWYIFLKLLEVCPLLIPPNTFKKFYFSLSDFFEEIDWSNIYMLIFILSWFSLFFVLDLLTSFCILNMFIILLCFRKLLLFFNC